MKRKTITIKQIRPITEITLVDGKPRDSIKREVLVGTEIKENILQLPVGVVEPNAKNCDVDITVDNFEYTLPDNTPAKKTVIKMLVVKKGDDSRPEISTATPSGQLFTTPRGTSSKPIEKSQPSESKR